MEQFQIERKMKILCVSRKHIIEMLEGFDSERETLKNFNIISIIEVDALPVVYPDIWKDTISLEFSDLNGEDWPDNEETRKIFDKFRFRLFTDDDAKRIIQFVDERKNNGKGFLIHCTAGICRSGAVGSWLAERTGVYNQFRLDNPHIMPNTFVEYMLRRNDSKLKGNHNGYNNT